jgi:hypothetical protein
MKRVCKINLMAIVAGLFIGQAFAQTPPSAEQKAAIEKKFEALKVWGTDETIVAEVKSYNENPPDETKNMSQDKWKSLTVLSPEVKFFTKNKLGTYIKSKMKDGSVSEMFISSANGNKVAFLAKTTNWCHKGKLKHDVPMKGKTWVGNVEVDESSGIQQVQVSMPVLDGGKPIGSIVIGLAVDKL